MSSLASKNSWSSGGFRHWLVLTLAFFVTPSARADERGDVLASTLKPFEGPVQHGVDVSTLTHKVMCGYQGWFNADGDGAELGWNHWTRDRKSPGPANIRVDLWPDLSELTAAERFVTAFRFADGRKAELFSSARRETVLRHFHWMREYGIDGAFIQRFVADLRDLRGLRHRNMVLGHCREGANREGRAYAVMYDLSGLGAGRIREVEDDWRELRTRMRVTEDPAYLHHRKKPLVAVWGMGFADGRAYSLAECRQLVEFLKADGCAVMLGVPTYWRELKADALPDPALHDLLRLADVISPWTVGRYRDDTGIHRYAEKTLPADLHWCRERSIDYLPVLFPGFSWHNMKRNTPLDAIPRQRGQFFWSQFAATVSAGAAMLYVAMFDEVDEGTAIFKCASDVPKVDGADFVTFEGLPSDYYLRLTGLGGKMLRGEMETTTKLPPP